MGRASISKSAGGGRILISDGAWGTFLQKMGLKIGDCPEAWNLSNPDAVMSVAASYIEAGADMVETNTFGGNRFRLALCGLDNQIFEINRRAAALSRKAAGENNWVIASVGPTGTSPMKDKAARKEIYNAFQEQVRALEEGGADAVCIETMSILDEALLAVQAAKENTGLEIICTFTFEKGLNGQYKTIHSPREVAEKLVTAGADIIGANCGNGIEEMAGIIREMRQAAQNRPLIAQANAGLPEIAGDQILYPETPDFMALHIPSLIEAGVNIIGGCCGTTPNHIRAMKKAVEEFRMKHTL